MRLIVKKKITLLVLLSTGIVLGYLSFVTCAIGFLLVKYFGGKTAGKPGRMRSHFIPLGKYRIHLHHWLLSSFAIMIFTVFKGIHILPSDLFYGFFGAIVFHGIYCYSDWHRILIPRQVQSLVVAKNLAIGKVVSVMNFPEMGQEIEEDQTSPRIRPSSSHYCNSQIGDLGSTQDRGSP